MRLYKSTAQKIYSIGMMLGCLFHIGLISHCSSSPDQGQQGEPVQNGLDNTATSNASLNGGSPNAAKQGAAINNAVGGSSENFAGANSGGNTGGNPGGNEFGNQGAGGNNLSLGEPMNNVPLEDPGALTSNIPVNAPLNQAAVPLTQTPTNVVPTNTVPVNTAATPEVPPTNAATVPTNTSAASTDPGARFAASPFVNPHMNWPGKGKVKYVTRQVTKHASPNGPVVGEYSQGEHPLVYQNGNWVELHDGSFVKGNGLTDNPVGYPKKRR